MITTTGTPIIAGGIEFGFTERLKIYARIPGQGDSMVMKVLEFITGRQDIALEYEGTARAWVTEFGKIEDDRLAQIIDALIKLRESSPSGRQLSFLSEIPPR